MHHHRRMTITAIHRRGHDACGRVAFFYDEDGASLDSIEAERVTLPSGDKPQQGDVMVCGACGMEIGPQHLDLLPGEWNVRERK